MYSNILIVYKRHRNPKLQTSNAPHERDEQGTSLFTGAYEKRNTVLLDNSRTSATVMMVTHKLTTDEGERDAEKAREVEGGCFMADNCVRTIERQNSIWRRKAQD